MRHTLLSTASGFVLSALVIVGTTNMAHAAIAEGATTTIDGGGGPEINQNLPKPIAKNPIEPVGEDRFKPIGVLPPKLQADTPEINPIGYKPSVKGAVPKPIAKNPIEPVNKPKKGVAYLSEDGNTFYDRKGNAYRKDGYIFYDHSGNKNNLTVDSKGRIKDAKGRILGNATPPKTKVKPVAGNPNTKTPLNPIVTQPVEPVAPTAYKSIDILQPADKKLPKPITSNEPTPVTIELPAEGTKKLANGFTVDSLGVIRNPNGGTIAFIKDNGTFTDAKGGAVTRAEIAGIKGLFAAAPNQLQDNKITANKIHARPAADKNNTGVITQNIGFRPNQVRPTAPQALQLFFGSDIDTKIKDLIGGNDNVTWKEQRSAWERSYTALDKNNLKAVENWRKNIQDTLQGKPGTQYADHEFITHNPPPEFWTTILTEEAVGKVSPLRITTDDAMAGANSQNTNSASIPSINTQVPANTATPTVPSDVPLVVHGGGGGGGRGIDNTVVQQY